MNKKLHLCRPNRKLICELNSVALDTVRLTEKLNDIDELSFEVDKLISLPEYGLYVQGNGYDDLHDSMEIYLEDIGFFQIQEPSVEYSSEKEKKVIVAYAISKELVNKNLTGFKINCGSVDSMEMLIDGNVNSLGFPNEYITLYNESNSKLSLLDIVLESAPGWTVGYVSESLKSIKLSFDIDNTNIFAFLTNMVSKDARCIFKFDTINKKVNVYKESEIGVDTGVLISLDNLANSINVSCSEDSIYTRFSVTGSDGIDIRTVNYGDDKIEDLSYYLNTRYLNSELIEKYNNYLSFREENRELYIEKMQDYEELQEKLSDFRNRVPNDGCLNEWGSMPKEELDKNLKYYNALLASLQVSVDPSPSYSGDTGSLDDYIPITNSEGETNHEWYMEQLSEQGSGVYTYEEIYKYIIPNITIALFNIDLAPDEQEKYVDGWRTEWDYYGLIELQGLLNDYNNQLESLSDYSKPWNELTEEEKNNRGNNEALYNQYHNEYVKVDEIIGDRYTNGSLKHALYMRQNQISGITSMIGVIQEDINSLVSQSELRVGNFDMTEEDIEILNILYKDTGCSNENILITSLDNTPEKRNIIRKELLSYAKEQLSISSQPQYSFSVNTDNIYDIPEFQVWGSSVKTGNFIRLNTYGTHVEKMRIVEITYNPCVDINELELSFSNVITCYSKRDDFSYLFGDAVSSGGSAHSYSGGSKDSVELSTDVLNLIANSRVFQGKFDNLRLQSIVSSEGVFNQIIADKAFITSAEIEKLLAEKAYITILEANNLYANKAEVNTILFGSASGKSIQSDFSLIKIGTTGEAYINDAMIVNLDAGKINSGTINTNNVTIQSEDGGIILSDNTMSFSQFTTDENTGEEKQIVRMQIGEDGEGNYNLYICDMYGNILFDALGITEKGISNGLITNIKISDKANISAEKINIDSLFSVINNDKTHSLKSSKVYFDDQGQTLDAVFSDMKTDLDGQISVMGSEIKQTRDYITNRVWQQDIDALSVGGRNYIYNSAFLNGSTGWTLDPGVSIDTTTLFNTHNTVKIEQSGFTADEFGGCQTSRLPIRQDSTFNKDETLTVSFWYYLDSLEGFDSANLNSAISGYKEGATSASTAYQFRLPKADLVVGEWTKVSYTATLSNTYNKCFLNTYINRNGCIWLADFKLEKGNKATDWTPAPEDVDNKISTLTTQYSTLDQTINGINMEVASYKTTTDAKISGIQDDFNNLQIGSRNLLKNSKTFSTLTQSATNEWNIVAADDYNILTVNTENTGWVECRVPLYTNYNELTGDVAISFEFYESTDDALVVALGVYDSAGYRLSDGTNISVSSSFTITDISDSWKRATYIYPAKNIAQRNNIEGGAEYRLQFKKRSGKTGEIRIRKPKIEKGNKATDWSPAPEDQEFEIGGRNLVLKSDFSEVSSTSVWSIEDGVATAYAEETGILDHTQNRINLSVSDYIYNCSSRSAILSIEYFVEEAITYGSTQPWVGAQLIFYNDTTYTKSYDLLGNTKFPVDVSTSWNKYVLTIPDVDLSNSVRGYIRLYFRDAKGKVKFRHPKLEIGNKATDWALAPEDTDIKISTVTDNVSKLEARVGSIEFTVSETCVTKDQLGNYATISQMNSAITQKADSITSTVAQTYTTKEDFNNLEIGGTQILRNTQTTELGGINNTALWSEGTWRKASGNNGTWESVDITDCPEPSIKKGWRITSNGEPSTTMQAISIAQEEIPLIIGDEYILSCYVRGSGTASLNTTGTGGGSKTTVVAVNDSAWKKYTHTFTAQHTKEQKVYIGVRYPGDSMEFCGMKIERGNKATAWTPAPEDTDAKIASVETIATQTADKFNWIVKSGTSITDFTLTDRMATLTASMISLNGNVKVNGSMIVDSAITTSKIAANAITADKIAANAITASKIAIGDFYNYATVDENVPESMLPSAVIYGGTTRWEEKDANGNTVDWWFIKTSASRQSIMLRYITTHNFSVGDELVVKFDAKTNDTGFTIKPFIWAPSALTYTNGVVTAVTDAITLGATGNNQTPSSTTSTFTFTIKITQAIVDKPYWTIGIYGGADFANKQLFVKNVSVRLKTKGELIVDGSITANHLSVSSLSAISANLGTVKAGIIQSTNYVSGSTGMKLTLSDGVWDSKYFKIASDGKITASGGMIGGWSISGSNLVSSATIVEDVGSASNYTLSLKGGKSSRPEIQAKVLYYNNNDSLYRNVNLCSDYISLGFGSDDYDTPANYNPKSKNLTEITYSGIKITNTQKQYEGSSIGWNTVTNEILEIGTGKIQKVGGDFYISSSGIMSFSASKLQINSYMYLKNNIALRSYQTDGTVQNLIALNSSNVTHIGSTAATGDVHICTGMGKYIKFYIGGTADNNNPMTIKNSGIYLGDLGRGIYGTGISGQSITLMKVNTSGTYDITIGSTNAAIQIVAPALHLAPTASFTSTKAMSVSSDQRVKTNISNLTDKYTNMLDLLQAKTFQYTYDTDYKLNCGFIAQDVLSTLSKCGLATSEFGGFCDVHGDGSHYALDYTQFIPILWEEVKKLRQQVKELKGENS